MTYTAADVVRDVVLEASESVDIETDVHGNVTLIVGDRKLVIGDEWDDGDVHWGWTWTTYDRDEDAPNGWAEMATDASQREGYTRVSVQVWLTTAIQLGQTDHATYLVAEPGDHIRTLSEDGKVRDNVVLPNGVVIEFEECAYTHSHTKHWCGNPSCREF